MKRFMAVHSWNPDADTWVADGGCSMHLTHDRTAFATYAAHESPLLITIPSGKQLEAVGVGSVRVRAFDGHEWHQTLLHEVHLVPDMHGAHNLFSLGHAIDRFGYQVTQTQDKIFINDGDSCCLTAERERLSLDPASGDFACIRKPCIEAGPEAVASEART